jgi:DNA invertase Pin-like site-specific DNA recombinase
MTVYGYARVSTADQTLDAQLDALRKAGVQKVWREKISGARSAGPNSPS